MTWTPDEQARLKGLRDRPSATSYVAAVEQQQVYLAALANAGPLARIEELEGEVANFKRVIREMKAYLEDHFDIVDGDGEDAGPLPNWAMRAHRELEAIEASHD